MEMYILLLLIFPIIFSVLFLFSNNKKYYKILSIVLCTISSFLSIVLVLHGTRKIAISGTYYHITEGIIVICEILITLFLYYVSIRNKRWKVLLPVIVSTFLSIYEIGFMPKSEEVFFNLDKLSLVMALIVNIIGSLIVIFANEYIDHYEKHRNMISRQKLFYFIICIFLSAMNGLIFSDSLSYVYFFWEVTTIASFILISYNNDKEALDSGFRALFLNLIGGICFLTGIIMFKSMMNIDSLSQIIENGRVESVYTIPVFLLCIAGFAKSAQLPFQSWLLGAMVAPTPVSALLHSSTMVKAGVYLIVKLSPAYAGTKLGTAIAIYGAVSFLICSALAVSQRNAKRVLAYSTIANLGLIISSAGLGSSIGISAAIMLIIFHAISKALLFLGTGQIEHTIGSRDIEDMTGLIRKAPVLTMLMVFAMFSMLLPPFGVLIAKWVSIEASAKNPLITILLVPGSALTTVYYVKWIGSLISYPVISLAPKAKMDFTTYFPLGMLGMLIVISSILITPIFNSFVSPEVNTLLNSNNELIGANGKVYSQVGSFNDTIVFLVIIGAFILYILVQKIVITTNIKSPYMCGENTSESSIRSFRSGGGSIEKAAVSNFYLSDTFDETKITAIGYILSISIIILVVLGGLL